MDMWTAQPCDSSGHEIPDSNPSVVTPDSEQRSATVESTCDGFTAGVQYPVIMLQNSPKETDFKYWLSKVKHINVGGFYSAVQLQTAKVEPPQILPVIWQRNLWLVTSQTTDCQWELTNTADRYALAIVNSGMFGCNLSAICVVWKRGSKAMDLKEFEMRLRASLLPMKF